MRSTLLLLSCCLLPAASQAAMTAYYPFNKSSGTTAADAVRGGAGTANASGGFSWTAGQYGNAVELNGSNAYLLAPNAVPTGTTAFSVAAWVWADSAPFWGSIVKNWGGSATGAFHLGFDQGSGRISNYLSAPFAGPVLAPTTLSLGAWHHVALTYNGSAATQTLYIDGVAVASGGAPSDLDALSPNMGIGVKADDATLAPDPFAPGFWDGKIDAGRGRGRDGAGAFRFRFPGSGRAGPRAPPPLKSPPI
jgi:uncharacterized protein